ncbi:MAG: protein kinase [Pirellulaceae bacterium]
MSKRITNNKVGYEPIPGYVLRKRLGAGGYGEVWLCDAPGGLQKAIKLIYGTVDESHATSELRSLQRIRQVYHPFLLSIERIEIISNQVVIITELAESSLLDRFEHFRRKGSPGIPRQSLLDYMRDTADALDFLAQKHALQHLDVKPGNLLIIADRVKVADFGLIKDLHDQNQSLVSGLTPSYSAPEIFDGRPDYRSDQYSLAIVYMEMLTGQLPFDGRTTGELARQHINQAPDLEALPPADRPVVGRALSKNPLDRFSTCRAFIEQLQKTRGAVLPLPNADRRSKIDPDSERESTINNTVQAPFVGGDRVFQPAIGTEQIASTWINPRSMFIGLGGVGGQALLSLRELAKRDCDCRFSVDELNWMVIDTDSSSLNQLTEEDSERSLPSNCAIQLPIYRPSEYRNADPDLFGPLSRRWLYNIPRSLKTEGVRPLAILSLLDHYPQLKAKLFSELRELTQQHEQDEECQEPLRIYVLTSLHGGTGSGLLAEVGFLIRRIMSELHFQNFRISAVAAAATTTNSHKTNLPAAAAIACLSELSFLMDPLHETQSIYFLDNVDGTSNVRPYDWVTLIDGGLHGSSQELAKAIHGMAAAVWQDAQTMCGAVLNESRTSSTEAKYGWLRTAATRPVHIASNISAQNLARWCCEQTLHHSLRYMTGPRGMVTNSTSLAMDHRQTEGPICDATTRGPLPTVSGDLPLTELACEEFRKRLLAELGVVHGLAQQDSVGRDKMLTQWARRMADNPEIVQAQLAADIAIWKNSIAKTVQMRVYNWKQVEQIQLRVIEGILDFCENDAVNLVQLFAPHQDLLGTPEAMLRSAIGYLRRFSEECMKLLTHFQGEGKSLSKRISSWCESISAEKVLNEASWEVNLSGLPPRLQLLASRVNAVLESTVHRLSLQIIDESERSLELSKPTLRPGDVAENINLNYMLSLSNDLVARIANEIGISESEFSESENADGVSLNELARFYPALADSGGRLSRLVVAPAEQQVVVSHTLDKRKLLEHTTVIPSTRSLGTYILCDAVGLHMRQLVTSLWRPSPATLQLSERLRTRVDIDWEPATSLVEIEAIAEDDQFPPPAESMPLLDLPSVPYPTPIV